MPSHSIVGLMICAYGCGGRGCAWDIVFLPDRDQAMAVDDWSPSLGAPHDHVHDRQHVRKRVSERDLNPMAVTCGVAHLAETMERITAGQRCAYVSEGRHAPYVHDRHRPDRGVRDYCRRCAMTGADRIRWSTAGAVFGVAVAAVASYEHAYERCGVAAFEVFRSRRDVLRAAFLCP